MTLRAAILTVSDRGSRGERVDESGPALATWLAGHDSTVVERAIIADEQVEIEALLRRWCDDGVADLVLTTGGTGLSPRDVTPDATAMVLDRVIPGFAEAMRAASLRKTPRAVLSRAVCGVRGRSLVLNLPGSPGAAVENLSAIWEAVPHAVRKIQGDMEDCAPSAK
jgi:molybdenum cofactor synthesis domain-containing protein